MVAIVTGVSRGIGYELVKFFAGSGVSSIIGISRSSERLKLLAGEVSGLFPGVNFIPVCEDVSLPEFPETLGNILSSHSFKVNFLVNNAGALINKPFSSLSDSDLSRMMEVNYLAPARIIRKVLPYFDTDSKAHVVNIGSMGGFMGSTKFSGLSGYSSSKAGLAVLTECLAEEFKGSGLFFNCLALGAVDTEMLREAFPGYNAPLSPAEMAGFIGNFTLTGHQFFNGKVLPVSVSTP